MTEYTIYKKYDSTVYLFPEISIKYNLQKYPQSEILSIVSWKLQSQSTWTIQNPENKDAKHPSISKHINHSHNVQTLKITNEKQRRTGRTNLEEGHRNRRRNLAVLHRGAPVKRREDKLGVAGKTTAAGRNDVVAWPIWVRKRRMKSDKVEKSK